MARQRVHERVAGQLWRRFTERHDQLRDSDAEPGLLARSRLAVLALEKREAIECGHGLVGLPGTLYPKPHRSGGDQEAALSFEQALVAVGAVAVLDVVGHRFLERVPIGGVGVVDDELADRPAA